MEAQGGLEAVRLCQERDFNIVSMGIMKTKLDAFPLQKIYTTRDLPILMLSAW
jgi:DNA-binding response OmpR family regulator